MRPGSEVGSACQDARHAPDEAVDRKGIEKMAQTELADPVGWIGP
jgi:hypothetical protein